MKIRTVQFGVTDACNLNCLMCTRASLFSAEKKRKPGYMSMELFQKCVKSLAESGNHFHQVFMAWIGESLLHSQFLAMSEELARVNRETPFFSMLAVNTNATRLNQELIDGWIRLANLYPEIRFHMAFSLDAWRSETLQKIKNRTDLPKIQQEIISFLQKNSAEAKVSFHITALVLEENLAEMKEFGEGWSKILTDLGYSFRLTHDDEDPEGEENLIIIKRAIRPNQLASDQLHRGAAEQLGLIPTVVETIPVQHAVTPTAPTKTEKIVHADSISKDFTDQYIFAEASERPPCPALWQYPVIHWDGRVTLCCKDTGLDLTVGDLNHQSFAEIWNHGEKVKQFRHWHLAGQFYFLPECAHCGNYDVSSIPDVELQSLLAETDQSTMADWRGWRQDNPETFTKRINSFVKVRPERMDELEKAIKRFSDLGMVKEAEQTQTIWKNNFSKYLRGLAEKGDQQKAEQVLIQQFEKLLNVHFDEVIALFRQENCEVESLLQLYKIDPLQFVKEQIPGLEEDFYLLTQWQLVHQKLIAKYALQRDIGNYYWHQQSYETAIFWFKRRLETASDDIACLKQLAFSHYHLGERAEAQMIAQKALSLREDFEMQRLLGHICLEESRFRDAKSAFLVAQKLEPRDWLSNFGLLQAQQATAKDLDRNLFLHLLEIAPDPQSRQEVHSLIDKKKDE